MVDMVTWGAKTLEFTIASVLDVSSHALERNMRTGQVPDGIVLLCGVRFFVWISYRKVLIQNTCRPEKILRETDFIKRVGEICGLRTCPPNKTPGEGS